jgi:hypothetical protein
LACYGREPYSATAYNYPDEGESIIFWIASTLLSNYTSSYLKKK